jgi:thioredoxin reductase (NADPH)
MSDKNKIYDVIIIGAGAAGLTAAIYTGRRELNTLILTKDIGGQAATTDEIENWPGEMSILGPDLMNKFKAQAEKWGTKIEFAEIKEIKKEEDHFLLKADGKDYKALTVILGFGLEHRKLGVAGEKEFIGKGVSYCATCDGPLFKGKTVGIVGGGNSALDATEYLAKITEKVYMFVRRDVFNEKAETVLVDTIKDLEKQGKVEIMWNTDVKEIKGETLMKSVSFLNNKTNKISDLELSGLFIEIGMIPQTEVIKGLVDLDERGQIVIDQGCNTSVPGIFAAGDVTISPYKQLVTSAGEGCKAALSAYAYIQKTQGKKGAVGNDHAKKKI